jgi:small nuclear ribonucleoprotein (snRNP)-like protein
MLFNWQCQHFMSKRIVRISSAKIYPSLENLIKKEINVVLQNGNTHFGKLASFTPEQLTLTDTRNHSHQLALSELYEIVYDLHSAGTIK